MPNNKIEWGSSSPFTITLNSLANNGARESAAIDNSGGKYFYYLVTVIVKLATGTPASDKAIYVYQYASEDGTNYTDNATGSDAGITLRSPTNLRMIGTIATPDAGALTYKSHPMIAGLGARKFGIAVLNKTNLAFDTTGCSASYSGVYATSL